MMMITERIAPGFHYKHFSLGFQIARSNSKMLDKLYDLELNVPKLHLTMYYMQCSSILMVQEPTTTILPTLLPYCLNLI